MKTKLLITLVLLSLVITASPVSANIIDDFFGLFSSLKPASVVLPSYNTIDVACDTGASCNLAGSSWNVDMLVTSSASKPNIRLTLPSGVSTINSAGETWKTQGAVSVSLLDKGATLNVPTAQINVPCAQNTQSCRDNNYMIWGYGGILTQTYSVKAFRPTQYSNVVTTHYTISIDSPTGNLGNRDVAYNYLSPTSVTFTDNLGNNAVISPMYQTNQGVNAEVSGRIFVDNGAGTYYLFDENAFKSAQNSVWNYQAECSNIIGSSPCITDWSGWYAKLLNYASPVSYTHLRAHETRHDLVCRLLLEKK